MSVSTAANNVLLSVQGIHKHFPGVHALKGVALEVCKGEVHALVGENGAGKSTLMQILAGVHQPEAGTIRWLGQPIPIPDNRSAQNLGIAIVYQERSLFGPLSVAENVFAARQPMRYGRMDYTSLYRSASVLLEEVGLQIDPRTPLETLSSAQQQLVEVAKALSLDAKLLILDEPTASLTPTETERLFNVVRRLQAKGVAIIYISHRLEEVFALANRITILKDGVGQGTYMAHEVTTNDVVTKMVGREIQLHQRRTDPVGQGRTILEVRQLQDDPKRTDLRPRLQNLNFVVRTGEVLGLAGLVGAGRSELALALFGARPGVRGTILLDGQPVQIPNPKAAIQAGIGYLPEDRKEAGLFLDMSIADNVAAVAAHKFGTWNYSTAKQRTETIQLCQRLRVVCRGPEEQLRNLSGGNQQKILLAKWLLAEPKVLIVDEPTRGVDVGAKAEIHELLIELAHRGTAVVVISSDLPEILSVSDRILVMREGQITGELPRNEANEVRVLELASRNRK